MSNLVLSSAIESALMQGDLSKLSSDQKLSYYKNVCESIGVNPLTKPFEYMKLNGKEVLYATKGCAEQLRTNNKISIRITDKQKIDDIFIVTVEASGPDGRVDSSTGAVSIAGLKGESLANAFMKAETKAKRRLTLSMCGLNMLDETEVETIKDALPAAPIQQPTSQILPFDQAKENAEYAPSNYVVTFGKFKSQELGKIDMYELNGYVAYIKQKAEQDGKQITGQVHEFMTAAENYLSSREFERT